MEKAKDAITEMLDNYNLDLVGTDFMADVILEALAAANLEIMPGWEPIENAPKDGTRFLATALVDGNREYSFGWWGRIHAHGARQLLQFPRGGTKFTTHFRHISPPVQSDE